MNILTFPPGSLGSYDYVVILSQYRGKLLLSRHKNRSAWEMQGGHIEHGETPEEAAERELYEESGALSFTLLPLCDYCGEEPGKDNDGKGLVFKSEITKIGPLPESEMEQVALFDSFPENLTYPEITKAIRSYISMA